MGRAREWINRRRRAVGAVAVVALGLAGASLVREAGKMAEEGRQPSEGVSPMMKAMMQTLPLMMEARKACYAFYHKKHGKVPVEIYLAPGENLESPAGVKMEVFKEGKRVGVLHYKGGKVRELPRNQWPAPPVFKGGREG